MSLPYDPDANAEPNENWDTTFLSDRDVSAQVPINFVPHPGVYVTAACFGEGVYVDDAIANCLSNLLSSQIRRYVFDIYWDSPKQTFGLCPYEIPDSEPNPPVTSSSGTTQANTFFARQTMNSSSSNSSNTFTASNTTTSSAPSYTVISSNSTSTVYQLGPYQCSNSLTLNSLTSIFNTYFSKTANTLDAKIIIWVLNLHLASSMDPAAQTEIPSSQLPNATNSVSAYLGELQDTLYTPGMLLSDRQNLNDSWYRRRGVDEPTLPGYYTSFALSNGELATDDGWPDENYIQVVKGKRLLAGFGEVDSNIDNYNFSMDGDRVYPAGYISAGRDVSFRSDGELSSGCFYDSTEFTVGELNNSWAVTTINSIDPPGLGDAADNLTTCGISQLLNVTLDGTTADQEAGPYQDFGNNAIFSWAYGQPQNDSSIDKDDSQLFRCAVMVSTPAYRGHWRVEYCSQRYRVACREAESPYLWRISGYSVPYAAGDGACTGNTSFDMPRTGLEMTYLYNKILADSKDDMTLLDGIWINFNSLSVKNCWVTTGVNGTCPYYEDASATHSRQILIPTIAALIVLILTVLTILIKCSTNARNSRIRRRGEGGWDYEGVPS